MSPHPPAEDGTRDGADVAPGQRLEGHRALAGTLEQVLAALLDDPRLATGGMPAADAVEQALLRVQDAMHRTLDLIDDSHGLVDHLQNAALPPEWADVAIRLRANLAEVEAAQLGLGPSGQILLLALQSLQRLRARRPTGDGPADAGLPS